MLKTVGLLFSFVALHAVIGQPIKTHPIIPQDTCLDLRPGGEYHNDGVEDPSDFSKQYDIKLSKSQINSKDTVQFTISGKDGNTMRGFMVQVRPEGSTTPVGKFIVDPSDPIVTTMDCGKEEKNTALLKFPVPPQEYKDFPEVSMIWSPNGYKGKVNLVATVMKTGKVFWVARKSSDLVVN